MDAAVNHAVRPESIHLEDSNETLLPLLPAPVEALDQLRNSETQTRPTDQSQDSSASRSQVAQSVRAASYETSNDQTLEAAHLPTAASIATPKAGSGSYDYFSQ
jgi:hypothetical protein